MLHELRVENLLLLERAELLLCAGLNVLTGETGAGKTMLAQALDLLLGGKARSGVVRPGASEAYVEGVFSMPPGELPDELAERIPDGADEVVLARRVWPDGRTRAYVCGRSATVADLRELGSRLMSFYGQHEHRKLMLSATQLEVLDGHGGPDQLALRARVADAYRAVQDLQARLSELAELAGARERELDLLTFELDEIEAAAPDEDEGSELAVERDRLRHLELLQSAAAAGAEALSPEAGVGVAELLSAAAGDLEAAAAIDPALAGPSERFQALLYEAQDLGAELRRYAEGVEGAPGRLEEVEERLALLARLERKHGGSLAEVLRYADACRARREQLEHADVALAGCEAELEAARGDLAAIAGELSAGRSRAAPALAAAVRARLAELAMADASFEVELRPRPDGPGPRGAEAVELMIAPNAGVPSAPLREIASGGELSRLMLALLGVAHAGQEQLLVFDEIDAGVGGHTARAVGEHLKALAAHRQILCITHLPQVASLAERHFKIEKAAATTTVTALSGDGVVAELVRMLGASDGDAAASQHARQLLRAA